MRAIIWTKYGAPDVLQLREVAKPEPKDHEVQIKVLATTAFMGDCEMRGLKFPFYLALPIRLYVGILKPKRLKILGQEFAGEITALGKNVRHYQKGDPVFGSTGFRLGAYAEYICVPVEQQELAGPLAIKPQNMSYEEAAAVNIGGLEALHFLGKGNIKPGERVLINGAGGSIGTFAIQLAKHFGAEVTAVDRPEKLDMMRGIGADHVIDYTQEDFTQNGSTYDVIFDVIGKSPFSRSVQALRENGRYLIGNPTFAKMVRGRLGLGKGRKKVILETATLRKQDLIYLKDLIEAGKIRTVIDRSYPLEEMSAAHRYVETGQKKGNVVITVR
jgi:NADPH:quinone reductase-like Zn-dependent oxidoreductase